MAKIHDLPAELLGKIAYFVLHKQTLACGSHICRAWRLPFQVYLFERIGFSFHQYERLQLLYSSDPGTNPSRDIFLNSIHSVHFWNGRSGDWANQSYAAYEHATIDIKFLPMIQSLNLTSICLSHAPFDWESLSLKDTRAVVDLFRQPMLREVMVDAIMEPAHFPLVILPLCPNLRSFGLRYEVPRYGQVFRQFNDKIATLIGVYKKCSKENKEGEDETQDPELVKLALGPVSTVSLQELTLSASAIPIFIDAAGNDVTLVNGARLTLNFIERYNPPTDPPDPQGLRLEKTPWFQVFLRFGANVTELRLHLLRYRAVTHGAYPTREALKSLVNLNYLDLAVDIQDIDRDEGDVVANQIQTWFANFLQCLPAPDQLAHVGIIYRMLVDTEPYRGVLDLGLLATALNQLDRVLSGQDSKITNLGDCFIVLSLHTSGRESPNAWEEIKHGVEELGGRPILSLFQRTQNQCGKLKAFAVTDPEYSEYIEQLLD